MTVKRKALINLKSEMEIIFVHNLYKGPEDANVEAVDVELKMRMLMENSISFTIIIVGWFHSSK